MEFYTIKNNAIPKIGFGTWQMNTQEAQEYVKLALNVGYRHIDTATAYENLSGIGQAIHDSKIARNEIFLTSKLGNQALNYASAKAEIDQSLVKLGLNYIDLLLIHWPNPIATRPNYQQRNAEVWREMEEAVQAGKIKSLGVSNFQAHHLAALFETAQIFPLVNQIYCNPSDQQEEVLSSNQEYGLLTEAYSSLGTGEIFKVRALAQLAAKYDKTVAQLVLRWHLEKGYLPLAKSTNVLRMRENLAIFDFQLQKEDIKFIDQLKGSLLPYKYPDQVFF